MELLSAASKIPFHFQSQNSSVAAYAPERATECSETTFGIGRAEESWNLEACQARNITSARFLLLSASISLPGTCCCCVSLLGLLARLISPSEKGGTNSFQNVSKTLQVAYPSHILASDDLLLLTPKAFLTT